MPFKERQMVTIVAIIALSFLEGCAVLTGTDGAYFLPVVAVIAGLAGYQVPFIQGKCKHKK
jgi:hypothetical protein